VVSKVYAKEKGLPHFEHVLVPRTKGFTFLVRNLPTSVEVVYDVTLYYAGKAALLEQALFQGKFATTILHMHCERIPFSALPKDEVALNKWLMDRFILKDKLLTHAKEKGYFPGKLESHPAPRFKYLVVYAIWCLVGVATIILPVWRWAPSALPYVGAILGSLALYTVIYSVTGHKSEADVERMIEAFAKRAGADRSPLASANGEGAETTKAPRRRQIESLAQNETDVSDKLDSMINGLK